MDREPIAVDWRVCLQALIGAAGASPGGRRAWYALVVAAILALPRPALAQPPAEPDNQRPLIWQTKSGVAFTIFPGRDLYPVYVADPHRPTNAIVPRFYFREGIADTRSPRWWLSAGGRFGILRIASPSPGGRSWQVGIEAGLDGVFDTQHSNENVGWDGRYGLTVSTASGSPWAFKIALLHVSAHLGDEHAARSGKSRIEYTREEVAVGSSYRLAPRWRAYGELGRAFILRYDGQDPWRLQGGLEYEAEPRLLGGRFAWFSAGDLASWQERGWRVDTTLQGGIVTRANGQTYRILLEFLDGRPQVGQFFKDTETSLALGVRVDF
jgi:hypothetical protein